MLASAFRGIGHNYNFGMAAQTANCSGENSNSGLRLRGMFNSFGAAAPSAR
jgi:hypothetical protein